MRHFAVYLLTIAVAFTENIYAQSQIITPDNQVVSFQSSGGTNNLLIGTSATYNTFTGSLAGQSNTSGMYNTYFGYKAGYPNTTGNNNTFVGFETGKQNTDGSDNVFIGYRSGQVHNRGDRNLIIGPNAGYDLINGQDNTLLGANTGGHSENLHNATAIGANARVMSSNAMVLGNNVNVGIGTSAPQNRLELTASNENRSGLRLTKLTAASPVTNGMTGKFLTVNDEGDVILSAQLSATAMHVKTTSEGQWADYVFAPNYNLQPLSEIEQYVRQNKHLPGIPSANDMTNKGVELTTLLATLVKQHEELTLRLIEQQKRIDQLERAAKKRR